MAENEILKLANANVKIAVSSAGASLTYFKWVKDAKEIDIMRPAGEKSIVEGDVSSSSMYPMLPYVNAIHGGNFVYYGIKRTVPNNVHGKKEPFDGDGWKFQWNVAEANDSKVVLTCTGDPKKGFPFSYSATVTYMLDTDGFSVKIQVKNLGILPMPCALGLHPFFPKTKDVMIAFKNKNVWEHNNTPLRDKPYVVSDDWRFEAGKKIYGSGFNTCFGGFDGNAEVTWASRSIKLKITSQEEFNHIILVVPDNKSWFSLQPSTSAIDVFNLASRGIMGAGMKSIGPDEEMEALITFKVENL